MNDTRTKHGSAMMTVVLGASALSMLALSMMIVSLANAKEQRGAREDLNARYVAEAGLAQAVFDLANGGTGNVGTANAPTIYGRSRYFVQATDLGDGLVQLVSTGIDDRQGARLELVMRRGDETMFRWAAFGAEWINFDSNAKVDSYDSASGTYASQSTNGSGARRHAREHGHTGSNGKLTAQGNVKIWGDALGGPGDPPIVEGNATVSGTVGMQAAPMDLPPIEVPSLVSSGNLIVNSNGNRTIGPGDLRYGELHANSNSTIRVIGPARIVVDSFTLNSNSRFRVDATDGPVEVFVLDTARIDSNAQAGSTTNRPRDLSFNILSDPFNTVELNSNGTLYGTIYAPNGEIHISSNFKLFGSVVARRVEINSNAWIHFDEDLLDVEGEAGPLQALAWRKLSYDHH